MYIICSIFRGGRLGDDPGFRGFCDAVYAQTRSSHCYGVLVDIYREMAERGDKYTKRHKQVALNVSVVVMCKCVCMCRGGCRTYSGTSE